MKKPIDRAIAKAQLERINGVLREPHILIGGLAVHQYHVARDSSDIDLVCEFETARMLLDALYPTRDWEVTDDRDNDYRPSFRIRNKVNELGTIIFGPKISERAPYDHIDWRSLKEGAVAFRSANGLLSNILVPTPHALAYTKFISFLGRPTPGSKLVADLKDFVNLTNNRHFSVSQFYDLIRKSKASTDLMTQFRLKSAQHGEILGQSCLSDIAQMFPQCDTLLAGASPPSSPAESEKFFLRPTENRVLARLLWPPQKKTGIIIPRSAMEPPIEGAVVAIGEDVDGISVRDRVLWNKYAGVSLKIAGEDHILVRQTDIVGVINA